MIKWFNLMQNWIEMLLTAYLVISNAEQGSATTIVATVEVGWNSQMWVSHQLHVQRKSPTDGPDSASNHRMW